VVGDVFGPAVAALTLGSSASKELALRMGRNSAFDHAGNVAIAALLAPVGWMFSQRAVFLLVPVFAVLATAAALSIPAAAIDQRRARGAAREDQEGERANDVASMRRATRMPAARHLRLLRACSSTLPTRRCFRWSVRSSPSRTGNGRRP